MIRVLAIAVVSITVGSLANAQATKPEVSRKTGPSAASLATAYSGPLKMSSRVLAVERAAARDPNPITRAAAWRYRYSSPFNSYFGYCGYGAYRPYRGFFPFTGGATSLGWWGPY